MLVPERHPVGCSVDLWHMEHSSVLQFPAGERHFVIVPKKTNKTSIQSYSFLITFFFSRKNKVDLSVFAWMYGYEHFLQKYV